MLKDMKIIANIMAGLVEANCKNKYGYDGDMSKYSAVLRTIVDKDKVDKQYILFDMSKVQAKFGKFAVSCVKSKSKNDKSFENVLEAVYDSGLYLYIKALFDFLMYGLMEYEPDDYEPNDMVYPYPDIKDIAAMYYLSLFSSTEYLAMEDILAIRNKVLENASFAGTEMAETLKTAAYSDIEGIQRTFVALHDLDLMFIGSEVAVVGEDVIAKEDYDKIGFVAVYAFMESDVELAFENYKKKLSWNK